MLIDVSAHIMTNARVTNFNTRMAFAPAACKVACMQSGSFETQKHLGCSIFVITIALTLREISDFVERTETFCSNNYL